LNGFTEGTRNQSLRDLRPFRGKFIYLGLVSIPEPQDPTPFHPPPHYLQRKPTDNRQPAEHSNPYHLEVSKRKSIYIHYDLQLHLHPYLLCCFIFLGSAKAANKKLSLSKLKPTINNFLHPPKHERVVSLASLSCLHHCHISRTCLSLEVCFPSLIYAPVQYEVPLIHRLA
jgi:hypothetical protein